MPKQLSLLDDPEEILPALPPPPQPAPVATDTDPPARVSPAAADSAVLPAPTGGALVQATPSGSIALPRLVAEAGPHASKRFFEFFTVPIRNRHTRQAYFYTASSPTFLPPADSGASLQGFRRDNTDGGTIRAKN
ncbi:MAG: hypothetical protein JWL77_1444 [Chthonomonadaceae bacterium]|nr:hypothetical protein [Chthonomonadaceae bacterium]